MKLPSNNLGWVGVDIGAHSVKLAQVRRQRGQTVLTAAAVVPRNSPWSFSDAFQSAPHPSQEEIRSALRREAFRGRLTASCTSMKLCDFQTLSVRPELSPEKRGEVVAGELQALFPDTHLEFGCWPVSTEAYDNTGAITMPTAWADQLTKDCAKSGLSSRNLNASPLAMAQAIQLSTPGNGPVAAIDWGYSDSVYCGMLDGNVTFVRTLRDCGVGRWVDSVREALAVGREEAEFLLREHADFADSDTNRIAKLVHQLTAERFRDLLDEIKKTIGFVRGKPSIQAPNEIFLFGGGSMLRNVDALLGRKLDLPVRRWSLIVDPSVSSDIAPSMLGQAIACSAMRWGTAA